MGDEVERHLARIGVALGVVDGGAERLQLLDGRLHLAPVQVLFRRVSQDLQRQQPIPWFVRACAVRECVRQCVCGSVCAVVAYRATRWMGMMR